MIAVKGEGGWGSGDKGEGLRKIRKRQENPYGHRQQYEHTLRVRGWVEVEEGKESSKS